MQTRWLISLVLPLVMAASPLSAHTPPPERPRDKEALTPAPLAVDSPPRASIRPPLTEREPRTRLPRIEGGKPIRRYVKRSRETDKDYRLVVDLSGQRLSFDVPEVTIYRDSINAVRRNDTMEVTARTAKLMSGTKTVAQVSRGRLLHVDDVKGPWIKTAVLEDGQRKIGWIHRNNIKLHSVDVKLYPTPAQISRAEFASAGLLVQKAKLFDDGLYAAVELAAQNGAGEFSGKRSMLKTLARTLARPPAGEFGGAEAVLLAAGRLGGVEVALAPAAAQQVDTRLRTFLRDPRRSKPLAFYTWSDELSTIFQQDRMLQTDLSDQSLERLLKSLREEANCRDTYEAYLRLVYWLTNPSSWQDLREALAATDRNESARSSGKIAFFPPSRSRETDLMIRLFGNRPIPPGFNLADELVKRIRDGRLDLTPTENSGWYDHQLWALEPLVVPERMAEARYMTLNDRYREKLVELFKGAYALTRETHIKQLEEPDVGAAPFDGDRRRPPPKPKFYVVPELSGEPLPTFCLRRAQAYRFVRGVLEETFGATALKKMYRQTPEGPVEKCLDDELTEIEGLFHGAYVTIARQMGMRPDSSILLGTGDAERDAEAFLHWTANHSLDPDLGRDVRMMVPVFYDVVRKKTKVWAMLGWQWHRLSISFAGRPHVQVFDEDDNRLERSQYELRFGRNSEEVVTPVTAEFYVDRLLDRDEFRRLLDTYRSRSAVLHHVVSSH